MADGVGLYFMRLDEAAQLLEIALYDGGNVIRRLSGPLALDIYAHFLSLADHGARDSFCDGVVMGLRASDGVAPVAALSPLAVRP